METKGFSKSKNFLWVSLVLVGLVIGFVIGITVFTNITGKGSDNLVYAEDKSKSASSIKGMDILEGMQNAYREIAAKVQNVVVKIDIIELVSQDIPQLSSPFDFLLPNQPNNKNDDNKNQQPQQKQEFKQPGLGSGVIVKKTGDKVYVLTNNHVVGNASEITITLHNQKEYKAKLVGSDERKDIALVVFETKDDVPVAELGDSSTVQVGDLALAVGNPLALESTVTSGIISAIGREGGPGENINDFIQTDAAINPGNSGGALVNIYGQVIGINTWIASNTGMYTGYGFAIPINNIKKAINDFITKGKIEYGWLGVQIVDPSKEFLKAMNITADMGTFVAHVFKGSPAEKAGIQAGDYITKINGIKVKNNRDVTNVVGDTPAGDTRDFEIYRQGKTLTLKVKLTSRKGQEEIAKDNKNLWPGISVYPLTDDVKKELKIDAAMTGIVITNIESGTPGSAAGLKDGDIIKSINNQKTDSILDFYKLINDDKAKEYMIRYIRDGHELIIGLVK